MPDKPAIRTARRRRRFLQALAEGGIVAEACRAAGAARGSFYAWRRDDPAFAAAWDEALQIGIATLEDEAIRRARDGVETPVFYGGRQIATVRKASDALLMFLLRAHRPQLYRDRPSSTARPARRVDPYAGGVARHLPLYPDPPDDDPRTDEEIEARIAELLRKAEGVTAEPDDVRAPQDRAPPGG